MVVFLAPVILKTVVLRYSEDCYSDILCCAWHSLTKYHIGRIITAL